MKRRRTKLIHEGKYAAEVLVELIEDDTAWSPYLSPDDVRKLETVRLALRRGDIVEAAKHGRVFELTPLAG
jgi:hypothetical protein